MKSKIQTIGNIAIIVRADAKFRKSFKAQYPKERKFLDASQAPSERNRKWNISYHRAHPTPEMSILYTLALLNNADAGN